MRKLIILGISSLNAQQPKAIYSCTYSHLHFSGLAEGDVISHVKACALLDLCSWRTLLPYLDLTEGEREIPFLLPKLATLSQLVPSAKHTIMTKFVGSLKNKILPWLCVGLALVLRFGRANSFLPCMSPTIYWQWLSLPSKPRILSSSLFSVISTFCSPVLQTPAVFVWLHVSWPWPDMLY